MINTKQTENIKSRFYMNEKKSPKKWNHFIQTKFHS